MEALATTTPCMYVWTLTGPSIVLTGAQSLTEMVRQLRTDAGQHGLVLANGGVASYQHVIILSSKPRSNGEYPEKNPLPEYTDVPAPEIEMSPDGEATIEVTLPHTL